MRRTATGSWGVRLFAVSLAVAVLGALTLGERASPSSGTLTLMRDEGGCIVGRNRGVQLVWNEHGATLASVVDTMDWSGMGSTPSWKKTVGPARPFPLERARWLARRFGDAMDEEPLQVNLFRGRTMSVQLDGETAHLDCRGRGDYRLATATSGATWDELRLVAYRAGALTPACEDVDPLLSGLLAEAVP